MIIAINKAITQAEALIDFRHEKPVRAKRKEIRGGHDNGGGDRGKGQEKRPRLKNHNSYKSNGKKFVCHDDTEKKTEVAKRGGSYICGGLHGSARCLELKRLGAILRDRERRNYMRKNKAPRRRS